VKRVLFDEDVPKQLRRDLPGVEVRTVQEQGWSSVQNGELLRRAEAEFDVLLTADKRLQFQQNISHFKIGVVFLSTIDTRLPNLQLRLAEIRSAIESVTPGVVVNVTTA
jgi:predicted nuclease of predicted toxin-antitoxin system